MVVCETLAEALSVPGVNHVEVGDKFKAYVLGDDLPAHLQREEAKAPQEVTMRQARLALAKAGKLAAVEAAIDALAEPQKSAARIEWEYSATVQRSKPLVLALAPALGLDGAALDQLFVTASSL